jgi:pimeloyl-ACP methyl ester carboxylesterase
MSNAPRLFRTPKQIAFGVYLLLLIASHVFQSLTGGINDSLLPGNDRPFIVIPNRGHDGEMIAGEMLDLVYQQWGSWTRDDNEANTPVLLMHGAPGMGTDFARIGGLLTVNNRAVYSPDLIGFAQSDMGDDVSYRVQARHMFSFLDSMGVERVHLVGWSNGGGVGLRMADLYPERVASLTMLASVGAQETEGSGSYFFEHVKYGVGFAWIGYLPELIPHFGVMGTRDLRIGWLWSFWDSDQRALTEIMPTIETPVMILHGRDDPLVAAWGAELHHEMMPSSKLVMLDASHFLPFMQAQETAGYLNAFFERHDVEGVEPETGYLNLAPLKDRHGFDRLLHMCGDWILHLPWWVQLIGIVVLVRWLPSSGLVITMLFTSMLRVDFGVAILGMMAGRSWWLLRGASPLDRPFTVVGWIRSVMYILPVFVAGLSGGGWTVAFTDRFGAIGFVVGIWLLWVLIRVMRLVVTWEGRQRIKAGLNRITNHEYWPTGLIYLTVLWWGLKRVLSGKGLGVLTVVNPGYSSDGGVQGESKIDINLKLGDDPSVLHCVLIEEDESVQIRMDSAMQAIRSNAALGGLPIICKPDRGERGIGVRLVETESELLDYCRLHPEPFVLQKYHPGEVEVGVLWVRHTESILDPEYRGRSGFIYAITVKHFPVLIGDGKRTLRRLILNHPRYRVQAKIFFERYKQLLSWVPMKNERVPLGFAGNHAQGAMFTDGAELITPELCTRIGRIVDGFQDARGRGFDIGRFDLRCESLEQLAKGEGFGIVELNGMTSEPTNLYDPERSIFWAWGVLGGYWKQIERLAQARIDTKTGDQIDNSTWRRIKVALVRVMIP